MFRSYLLPYCYMLSWTVGNEYLYVMVKRVIFPWATLIFSFSKDVINFATFYAFQKLSNYITKSMEQYLHLNVCSFSFDRQTSLYVEPSLSVPCSCQHNIRLQPAWDESNQQLFTMFFTIHFNNAHFAI